MREKKKKEETINDILDEMSEHTSTSASSAFYNQAAWKTLISRIRRAHLHEIATVTGKNKGHEIET